MKPERALNGFAGLSVPYPAGLSDNIGKKAGAAHAGRRDRGSVTRLRSSRSLTGYGWNFE
jgi:hypothetical protein